jgi:hypothetical protein
MKMLIGLLLCVGTTLHVLAQQRLPYGPIAVIAVSNDSDRGIVMEVAKQVSDVLRKEEKIVVNGDVQFVPPSSATDSEFITLAGKYSVQYLVVASLKPSDNEHRILDVEVLHTEANKIVERASALVRSLRTVGSAVAEEIHDAALNAAHAITTFVSQFKEVWVILQFLSAPPEASYVFDTSSSGTTDKQGIGKWEGTQPVGKTTLQVWKQGYSKQSVDIDIPSHGSTPYIVRLQVITLKAGH